MNASAFINPGGQRHAGAIADHQHRQLLRAAQRCSCYRGVTDADAPAISTADSSRSPCRQRRGDSIRLLSAAPTRLTVQTMRSMAPPSSAPCTPAPVRHHRRARRPQHSADASSQRPDPGADLCLEFRRPDRGGAAPPPSPSTTAAAAAQRRQQDRGRHCHHQRPPVNDAPTLSATRPINLHRRRAAATLFSGAAVSAVGPADPHLAATVSNVADGASEIA